MAEVTRMTADEVVSYFLEGEGVDVLRESARAHARLPRCAHRTSPGAPVGSRRFVAEP